MCLRVKQYFIERRARKDILKLDDLTIDQKIKIQGTNYDRKRKYSLDFFDTLRKEYQAGATCKDLAYKYDMNYMTVRYNLDTAFRQSYNARRKKGTHAIGAMDFDNRVAYKRKLVKTKKINPVEVI